MGVIYYWIFNQLLLVLKPKGVDLNQKLIK